MRRRKTFLLLLNMLICLSLHAEHKNNENTGNPFQHFIHSWVKTFSAPTTLPDYTYERAVANIKSWAMKWARNCHRRVETDLISEHFFLFSGITWYFFLWQFCLGIKGYHPWNEGRTRCSWILIKRSVGRQLFDFRINNNSLIQFFSNPSFNLIRKKIHFYSWKYSCLLRLSRILLTERVHAWW